MRSHDPYIDRTIRDTYGSQLHRSVLLGQQEGLSVECQPPACGQPALHSERDGILGDTAVSLHTLMPIMSMEGGKVLLATQNSKFQVMTKFLCGAAGGWVLWTKSNLKFQPLSEFSLGGRDTLDTTFIKYLSGGIQGNLHQNFYQFTLLLYHR